MGVIKFRWAMGSLRERGREPGREKKKEALSGKEGRNGLGAASGR
jgi:hypothetical protein